MPSPQSATLLISCPDQRGIVAAITRFIYENNGNIIHLDQHVDFQEDIFFSRVEWDLTNFSIPANKIVQEFNNLARTFDMRWELHFSDRLPKMAIFVSKLTHCLSDILSRVQSGEWNVEIPMVISNHTDVQALVEHFGILFYHFPINKENKLEQEKKQIEILEKEKIDVVVLARYMQILTPLFVEPFKNRIINIHHSFLPAFAGAKPYHSAYSRGVKIIGATSHYVTADLDAGPIIEQDIIRVSHKDNVENLVRKGKDLEKIVLSRAIWYHLQNKILVYNNKTVIFD
ncbi:formyltetrahydrofolate deformylase [candidate division KSB1 bacterium]|nr:formyltetrahydrofolate deformylase [candidate division KSB1 bacterium]